MFFSEYYATTKGEEEKIRNDTVLRVLKKDQFHAAERIDMFRNRLPDFAVVTKK